MAAPLSSRPEPARARSAAVALVASLVTVALVASGCGSSAPGAGAVGAAGTATASGGPTAPDPNGSPGATTTGSPNPSAGQGTNGPAGSGSATPGGAAAPPTYSRVLLAGGVHQWIHCAGSGPVTVVVVPGLGSSHDDWADALPGMEQVVRTCVYDRPGIGSSPPRPSPHQVVDAGLHARELHALLRAAGERGPYVVLGHSYGGLVARAFVHLYAGEVRGVLLAEGVTPGDLSSGTFWTEAGHRVDLVASSRADAGGPAMGRLPLLVLSASDAASDLWARQQQAATRLSSDSVQVVATSGHIVMEDDPAAVVEATRAVVSAATGGGPLGCSADWAAVSAYCR